MFDAGRSGGPGPPIDPPFGVRCGSVRGVLGQKPVTYRIVSKRYVSNRIESNRIETLRIVTLRDVSFATYRDRRRHEALNDARKVPRLPVCSPYPTPGPSATFSFPLCGESLGSRGSNSLVRALGPVCSLPLLARTKDLT